MSEPLFFREFAKAAFAVIGILLLLGLVSFLINLWVRTYEGVRAIQTMLKHRQPEPPPNLPPLRPARPLTDLAICDLIRDWALESGVEDWGQDSVSWYLSVPNSPIRELKCIGESGFICDVTFFLTNRCDLIKLQHLAEEYGIGIQSMVTVGPLNVVRFYFQSANQ